MEEQKDQNLEQQEIEKNEVEHNSKEESKEVRVKTTIKKLPPQITIGLIAFAIVAIIVILIIVVGGNKGITIICKSCGASMSENVKFCSGCGERLEMITDKNDESNK